MKATVSYHGKATVEEENNDGEIEENTYAVSFELAGRVPENLEDVDEAEKTLLNSDPKSGEEILEDIPPSDPHDSAQKAELTECPYGSYEDLIEEEKLEMLPRETTVWIKDEEDNVLNA